MPVLIVLLLQHRSQVLMCQQGHPHIEIDLQPATSGQPCKGQLLIAKVSL